MVDKDSSQVILGIPKGSLQKSTTDLMARAGYRIEVSSRSYYPAVDDPALNVRLVRPQDMSRFVEKGIIDAGLTGADWVQENESDVRVICELVYAKQELIPVRWVLAVPQDSDVQSVADLQGKKIATELVNVAKKYLAAHNVSADVEFSHGATETKAPDIVDAIIELTETGSSLRANKLRIVDTVMKSVTVLVVNHDSWKNDWKREKIENIAMLLQGAMLGRTKVGLKMNVGSDGLDAVLAKLPALRRPTVSTLADESGYAIETVLEEKVARDLIPELKRLGAEGIIEFPLNKVVL